jgi:hypothetical protein
MPRNATGVCTKHGKRLTKDNTRTRILLRAIEEANAEPIKAG